MAQKKPVQKSKGTSGGAAAAGGVGFQQCVAAYALAHVLVGDRALRGLALAREFDFRLLQMESAHAVDDVVIIGHAHRALIQAKTTVALSDSQGSTYAAVLRQFVAHHTRDPQDGDAYILATSAQSSRRIVVDLLRLTESVRLNPQALVDNPLTEAEEDVLSKTRTLIAYFLQEYGVASPSDADFLAVFRRVYVLPLDFSGVRGRDYNAAVLLLSGKSAIDGAVLWAALVELCGGLATSRGSIDTDGLRQRLGHYVISPAQPKTLLDEFALQQVIPKDAVVGKDVMALYSPGKENETILLVVNQRFDNDGSRITAFTRDGFRYRDGTVQRIICRASTPDGVIRYLSENPQVRGDRNVGVMHNNLPKSLESTVWAKAHKALLRRLLEQNTKKLNCVVCGLPISENGALVVEIDEEGIAPAAGNSHKRCYYPGLRILGELQSSLFEHYEVLRDFDFNRWISAAYRNGQSALATDVIQGVATMLWNSRLPGQPRGSWCVRIDASDGSSHYITNRAKVLRFTEPEAREEARLSQLRFEEAIDERDPYCVSEDRLYFAKRSMLLKKLPRGSRILQCLKATAVQFNVAIDKAYSLGKEYYAPVVLLIAPDGGGPVEIAGAHVVLTDPFKIIDFLDNWTAAGIDVKAVAAEVLDTDERFDRVVGATLAEGKQLVVDPVFDSRLTLVSGIQMQENV